LAWQLHSLLFPSFTDTAAGLLRLLTMPVFWRALAISHQALLLGYAAAAVVGVLIGFVMGRSPRADSWLDPYVVVLLITPMSALIPLVIIALGIGLLARALVVMLFAVVVIAVNVRAGIRALDPGWLEMVRSSLATIGPSPATLSERSAATLTAPAPSTTSFARSRSSTIACEISSSETWTMSSSMCSSIDIVSSPGCLTKIPSAIV